MADLIRHGTPADVGAITDLTMHAYSKWLALIGYEPLPMLADYAVAIREHRFDLLEVDGELAANRLFSSTGLLDWPSTPLRSLESKRY